INAPLLMKKDAEVNTASANQTLTLTQFQPSAVILSKTGPGTLELNNARVNGLRITGGTVKTLTNGGPNGVSVVGNLSIAGGKLDLNNNKLVTKTPVATITPLIASGRGTGTWNGTTGIVTSQSTATTSGLTS